MKIAKGNDANFGDGRRAAAHYGRQPKPLAIDNTPIKAVNERGADPYNSSGGFDRRNNWARVGKR